MSLKTLLVVNTLWYLSTDVQGQGMGMGPCQSSVDFDSLPAPSEAAPQIKYASAIAGYYNTPRAFIDSVRSGILPYGMLIISMHLLYSGLAVAVFVHCTYEIVYM